ncbi:MAG TPA: zinc-binding dehydrogenase, partial [Burkholderiales bacterium]|nr:zinc-binding dehydrogenase [Burkholderiales bacterium]
KAMVLESFGAPLKLKDVPVPKPGPNEALVKVKVCGAGLTVVIMIATPGRIKKFPRIPGHEIAGEIVEIGSEVKSFKVGQRVTNHFYLTSGNCRYCRSGRETLCENFRGNVGQGCDGGYAEYIALPERNLVPIPDGVSDLEAAVAADAIATPYHACHAEAQVSPGDNVLIIGAGGGVGIHMVQMARLCGGRVLAAEIGEEKLELARSMGADEVIDTRRGDLVKQVKALTGGRGVDAAIDIVGNSRTLQASLESLAPAGRMVIIGSKPAAVYGEDPTFKVNPGEFMRQAQEIHGSRYVNNAEIARTLELVKHKRVRAVVNRTFPLEEAEQVHELLRKNAIAGRAALLVG